MITLRFVALAFAALGLAGCGGAGSSAAQGGFANSSAVPGPARPSTANTVGGSSGTTGPIAVGTPAGAGIERSVTAAYTVPSGKFLESFEGVITRGVGLGGYVDSSSTQPDSSGRIVSGQVTMKIPAAKIADFLNAMPSAFVASSIDFASVNHSGDFVDVNARLASAHAHLDALDNLLAKATALNDITDLEQQIETVQTEINTNQGRLNTLTASVELSTTAVQLTERGSEPLPAAGPVSTGINLGWSNAVQVTGGILEAVVTALPFAAIGILALLLWRRLPRSVIAQQRRVAQPGSDDHK
jgi:hypothetical protein